MEGSSNSDVYTNSISPSNSSNIANSRTRLGMQVPRLNFFQSPLSIILEYSGIVPLPPDRHQTDDVVLNENTDNAQTQLPNCPGNNSSSNGEVSIRIIGSSEVDNEGDNVDDNGDMGCDDMMDIAESEDPLLESASSSTSNGVDLDDVDEGSSNSRDSTYQRYNLQQVGKWIEQILPFTLLLLVVFIRQHLQGFFVTIWIAAVMFKSNDILRKQTALKAERRNFILVGIFTIFILYVISVYWWYQKDDVLYPLIMFPPKVIPPFWHAVFIILLNDIMVRQAAMAFKCLLLIYYKNGRGHSFRRQGQMLTLVEYALLLYRALLPAPVWYRFFLNKDNGSLFSSLTTGLYLTFKLTSVVDKVRSFLTAMKALSDKEVHYGAHATKEQVNAAGDLCAICQEKMHAPILLRCKHIFCEECVSEWFERERTCPLCRALVKAADLQSFGDGSTSLFFQFF